MALDLWGWDSGRDERQNVAMTSAKINLFNNLRDTIANSTQR